VGLADAALNVGSNLFFNKYSQCGLTVAVGAGRYSRQRGGNVQLLGSQPYNAAKALDAARQAQEILHEAEWSIADPATGSITTIIVRPIEKPTARFKFAALRKGKS
jgi:hypothetical protein